VRFGDRVLNGLFGDLVNQHAVHALVILGDLIGDMPSDRFAFAIRIGSQVDVFFPLRRFFELVDHFLLRLNNVKVRGKIFFDVDAELAFRQIDDMADRRFDLKVPSQILFQGPGLGWGLDDN
jgi:hypothetical protein